jgi:hypothetical protein
MSEKTIKTPNVDKFPLEDAFTSERKIGQTIYVATSGFNGNAGRDLVSALVRLMERDLSNTA